MILQDTQQNFHTKTGPDASIKIYIIFVFLKFPLYLYSSNLAKTAHHSKVFNRAIPLKLLLEEKISNLILWGLHHTEHFLIFLIIKCNKDDYEMLIRILHSFLNRSTNIIMDKRYMDSSAVKYKLIYHVFQSIFLCKHGMPENQWPSLCILQKDWEDGYRLAAVMNFRWPQCVATNLKTAAPNASSEGLEVMKDLMRWNPKDRPSAIQVRKFPSRFSAELPIIKKFTINTWKFLFIWLF